MVKIFNLGTLVRATVGILSITIACTIYRNYHLGRKCKCKKRYTVKDVIIITGSTSGIGLATAIAVAKKGARIILANNDRDKSQMAKKEIIKSVHNAIILTFDLNLASFRSIRAFAENVKRYLKDTPLAAIVNTEEIYGSPHVLTEDSFDITFQINYLGPFLLIKLLMPLMANAADPRIVNLSSAGHATYDTLNVSQLNKFIPNQVFDRNRAYYTSKLCLALYTCKIALNGPQKMYKKAFAVDPGNVTTGKYFDFTSQRVGDLYHALPDNLKCIAVKTPHEGCQGILHALLSPVAIFYIKDIDTVCHGISKILMYVKQNESLIDELHEQSMIWTGLRGAQNTNEFAPFSIFD